MMGLDDVMGDGAAEGKITGRRVAAHGGPRSRLHGSVAALAARDEDPRIARILGYQPLVKQPERGRGH